MSATLPALDTDVPPPEAGAAQLQAATPWWLAGGHAQTIWPALFSRRTRLGQPAWRRERWTTPDQDFVDADWLDSEAPDDAPLMVMFHGLEGSSASHYVQAMADTCRRRGWRMVLPHFRGCSGELNLAPRAYHSGDHAEIGWMLAQARARHAGPMVAVGVSLGGNALMRWAQEAGGQAGELACAVASVCSPLDLHRCGEAIAQGFNFHVYTRMFLRTMKPKAQAKWLQHPGLFDLDAVMKARTIKAFDHHFTAPLHGFASADDYYTRASAKPGMARIRIPALALNARNDPFVPADCLPRPHEVGNVTLWQPETGGHVGFAAGRWRTQVWQVSDLLCDWMAPHLPHPIA